MSATPDDVEIGLGRSLTDGEVGQVDQWIGDVELQIRGRLGDLDALDQDILAYVVREAVLERLRNPDNGLVRETESVDDYSHAREWGSTKRVRIWPEWWEMLSPTGTSEAFTIRPGACR